MREFEALIDYYAVLGLTRMAVARDIKNAHRTLAMQHHPDKGGDASAFVLIQTAYEVLMDDETRAAYDLARDRLPAPVEESQRRGREPQDKAEFIRWLDEDCQKYPQNQSFQRTWQYKKTVPNIRENLWALLESQRISYADFESEALNEPLLWMVVISDDAVTEYVCNAWNTVKWSGSDVNLIKKVRWYWSDFSPADEFDMAVYEGWIDLWNTWQKYFNEDEEINYSDLFLLDVLSNREVKDCEDGYVSCGSTYLYYNKTREEYDLAESLTQSCHAWSKSFGLSGWARAQMVQLIRTYRSGESAEKITFNDMRSQLRYIGELIFRDNTWAIRQLYKHIIAPLEVKLAECKARDNDVSRIKVEQLNCVIGDINTLVFEELVSWIDEQKSTHEMILVTGEDGGRVLNQVHQEKRAALYKKVIDVIEKYAQKKEIAKHRNRIGAVLKSIGCAAAVVLTVGLALLSRNVRHGLFGRTSTSNTLQNCRDTIKKETSSSMGVALKA